MPTSSSQALIGGLVGAGLTKGGLEAIKASSVQKAAVFMVLSPLVGMVLAALLLGAIKLVFGRTGADRTERGFRYGP
jgi:PiT family inorganic phosphate transporter